MQQQDPTTTTTAVLGDHSLPVAQQQGNGGLPSLHQNQDQKIDTEKFMFWKIAKTLHQQRRREEKGVVMKYQQQHHHHHHHQPNHVPAEIDVATGSSIGNGGGADTQASIRSRQQKDAAWLFAPTTTEDDLMKSDDPPSRNNKHTSAGSSYNDDNNDDNNSDDDMSCVSDVTRELQDIDAPALYPSLDCLEQVLPDIEVSQSQQGRIEVSSKNASTSSNLDERETYYWTARTREVETIVTEKKNNRSSEARQVADEEYDFSNLMLPNSDTIRGSSRVRRSATSETSPKLPQRRLSLGSNKEDTVMSGRMSCDIALSRKVSSTSPVLPQRSLSRRSLESHCSSSIVDLLTHHQQQKKKDGLLDRQTSKESPVPPLRRYSLECSQLSGMDFQYYHHQESATAATTALGQDNNARTRQDFEPSKHTATPSREELGYGEETDEVHHFADANHHHVSPRLPFRQASSSSLDDNSTIATETLGLYRRRTSIDSIAAEPLDYNRLPDTPPSRPQRRMSTGSTMQGSFLNSSLTRFTSFDESNNLSPNGRWRF